jgi:septal ring factor EnvC (AmiA/AmiB activator)
MSEKPLVFSLLVGLIVVLVIAGVSLSVQVNRQSEAYKKEVAKNISLQKDMESIQGEKERLAKDVASLNSETSALNSTIAKISTELAALKLDKEKTEMLKQKLEENLKDELYKKAAVPSVEQPEAVASTPAQEAPKGK